MPMYADNRAMCNNIGALRDVLKAILIISIVLYLNRRGET